MTELNLMQKGMEISVSESTISCATGIDKVRDLPMSTMLRVP